MGSSKGKRQSAVATKVAAWVKCEVCDDFMCNIHKGLAAHDCACPELEVWDGQLGLNPYEEGGEITPEKLQEMLAAIGYEAE